MSENNPKATIVINDEKKIVVELYPEIASNTVNNFIELAQSGYYDGLIFHRVIKNFMIQGGCPDGTGLGGPGYSIKGEFTDNGFENKLLHKKGVISMARSRELDSAGSQFFIMHKENTNLDGLYAAFGEVIEGIEYVDEIANVKTDSGDKPENDVVIQKIMVDLNGYELLPVEKIE
jgi:peptidyl-prolyl cis-trans isomerase B (cyclophilin B)